jgi:hypothetical protein
MSNPKSNSPGLWKYPKRFADLLFPGLPIEQVSDRLVAFAETYDDTAVSIPLIRWLVPRILTEEQKPLTMPEARSELASLAFEAHGAAASHLVWERELDLAAVFIWITFLSYCDFDNPAEGDMPFRSSCAGLREFCMRSTNKWILDELRVASYDFALVFPWGYFIEPALIHIFSSYKSYTASLARLAVDQKVQKGMACPYPLKDICPPFDQFCDEDWARPLSQNKVKPDIIEKLRQDYLILVTYVHQSLDK